MITAPIHLNYPAMKASVSLRYPLLIIALFAFAAGACRTTLDLGEGTIFRFDFEGEQYEIIGYNEVEGREEGVNDLVLRDGSTVRLWARDNTQDGFIDSVIQGDVSLQDANRIYLAGIRAAMERGSYKERPYARRFEILSGFYAFDIISLSVGENDTYNLFIIRDIKTQEIVSVRDFGRDGILDDPLIEEEERDFWQPFYTRILEKGREMNRIGFDGNQWLVHLP